MLSKATSSFSSFSSYTARAQTTTAQLLWVKDRTGGDITKNLIGRFSKK